MKVIIDRFEGDLAVCEKEDGSFIDISKESLPNGAKAGDVLVIKENDISIDKLGTKERRERINKLMEDIWE